MKRLIPLLTLALSFPLFHSHAETVTSVNIVGMIKTEVPANSFEMLSLPFNASGGETTLGQAFSTVSDLTTVFLWVDMQYKTYTYYVDGDGWYDTSFNPADDVVIAKGSAFWIQVPNLDANFIHAGEVPDNPAINVNYGAGFNLVSVPYPVPMKLGDIEFSNLSDLDSIFLWNGAGYVTYTYYTAGNGWYDTSFASADEVEIPVGKGFWFSANAAGLMTINKPF